MSDILPYLFDKVGVTLQNLNNCIVQLTQDGLAAHLDGLYHSIENDCLLFVVQVPCRLLVLDVIFLHIRGRAAVIVKYIVISCILVDQWQQIKRHQDVVQLAQFFHNIRLSPGIRCIVILQDQVSFVVVEKVVIE